MSAEVPAAVPRARWTRQGKRYEGVDLPAMVGARRLSELPYALRIVLENVARNVGPDWNSLEDVRRLSNWRPGEARPLVAMRVSRVILPDSSGLPVLMDLASLRDVLAEEGQDPGTVQPAVPVDLVIDHSVMVDHHGDGTALVRNMKAEFQRNDERYRFLKWAQQAFSGVRVVPPGIGIIHQVHLEYLARVLGREPAQGQPGDDAEGEPHCLFPEFVLGGDSHTPMVNGLGVLAWGVGGVEVEAAMLGQPYLFQLPRFVGVELKGSLRPGVTTTDLVLAVTERLRKVGVVDTIVEFFGEGCSRLTVPDRATIANMAPEYGATAAYFPIDANTLRYLSQTGRDVEQLDLIEAYTRRHGFFRSEGDPVPTFDAVVDLDLDAVAASVAGPSRPQDRQPLGAVANGFREALRAAPARRGYGLDDDAAQQTFRLSMPDAAAQVRHGVLAIAAITACTNTSNPSVMLAAGLLARRAVEYGLRVPAYVKTSLAPGSRVVTRYLEQTDLLAPLQALGFHVVGYGCTTCSGKSGPLVPAMAELIERESIVAAAVVSSNRNFMGRIHRQVRAAYLASPPLVVAFALAGRVDIDLEHEPLGVGRDGRPVFLRDLWPDPAQIDALLPVTQTPALYLDNYASAYAGTADWQSLPAAVGARFPWDPESTYLLPPPFFADPDLRDGVPEALEGARALAVYGDTLTTDHISPAGEIPVASEAGRYLHGRGVTPSAFNAFTMRRGNHHVMMRGTFAHPMTHNLMAPESPGTTRWWPQGTVCSVFEAAERYRAAGVPMIVLGGRDYGMGSSRDWAAKGPRLLGVRVVIAESFERIHRANLIALGIVPLLFPDGASAASLGLTGAEQFMLEGLREGVMTLSPVTVVATAPSGSRVRFEAVPALSSAVEAALLDGGGIFARVVRSRLSPGSAAPAASSSVPSKVDPT